MFYSLEIGFPSLNAKEQIIFNELCKCRRKNFKSIEERFDFIAKKSFVKKSEVKKFVFSNNKFFSINGSKIQGKSNFFKSLRNNSMYIGSWFRNSQLLCEKYRITHEAAIIYSFIVSKMKQYGKNDKIEISQKTLCKLIGCTTIENLKKHIKILENIGLLKYIIRENRVYKKKIFNDKTYFTIEKPCGFFACVTTKSIEATFRVMQLVHNNIKNLKDFCKDNINFDYCEIKKWWMSKRRWRVKYLIFKEIWELRLSDINNYNKNIYYSII